jgi:uncharacterized membrane protein YqhA
MSDPKAIGHEPVSRRKPGLVERMFETLLWQSRFLVLLAVIPSIFGAVVLFIIAGMDIFEVVNGTWHYYVTGNRTVDIHETVVADIVGAVDIYLIAIVLLIFSLGTYKLFISRIEPSEDSELTNILDITSLDELKDRVARVVILAVIIEFFRAVVDIPYDTPLNAVYLAASVLALAVAISLMRWAQKF